MNTHKFAAFGAALAVSCIVGAHAVVTDVASNGFMLKESVEVNAPPDKIYAVLIRPSQWWNKDHTFSGNAANLKLDARAGGCFCEKLPGGGSVLHLSVVYAAPGESLRLTGLLGPFQSIAGNGVMTWTITPGMKGKRLEMTYQIAGYANAPATGRSYADWAKAADAVLSEQIVRLKRAIETGSPEAAKAKQ
jgi:uncharacterized protein YndB with AHSA1/START domain